MKPLKDENEVASKVKSTAKYAFVAPGAIGKGQGRGLRSTWSLGVSRIDNPFSQTSETGIVAKGRGRCLRSMVNAPDVRTTSKNPLDLEKGHVPSFSSTNEVMKYIQANSASA